MKLRLDMIEVKGNYKNKFKDNLICDLCKKGEDNTKHIFNCEKLANINMNIDITDKNPTVFLAKTIIQLLKKKKRARI